MQSKRKLLTLQLFYYKHFSRWITWSNIAQVTIYQASKPKNVQSAKSLKNLHANEMKENSIVICSVTFKRKFQSF